MKNIILQRIKNENYAFRPYGTCSTAAGVQEKIVSIVCPDKTDNSIVFSLLEGAEVGTLFVSVLLVTVQPFSKKLFYIVAQFRCAIRVTLFVVAPCFYKLAFNLC